MLNGFIETIKISELGTVIFSVSIFLHLAFEERLMKIDLFQIFFNHLGVSSLLKTSKLLGHRLDISEIKEDI